MSVVRSFIKRSSKSVEFNIKDKVSMTELRRRAGAGRAAPAPARIPPRGAALSAPSSSSWGLQTLLKGLLVVVVVPPLLNTAGLAREREVLQENLTRVDLGAGQWAWLQCEGRGQPIVLLEAGTGEAGDSWIEVHVQAALAPLTRVCRYDRAVGTRAARGARAPSVF